MYATALHAVEVSAPSRLHFGLLSLGNSADRRYGGAGVMVEAPRVVVRVTPDKDLVVRYGPMARRIAEIAQAWSRRRLQRRRPPVYIELRSQVVPHQGLGSGTQLALAIARALNHCFELEHGEPKDLAASVDRGQRSAVGTYGFCHGGLVIEAGDRERDELAELTHHARLPDQWRFLLVRVGEGEGKSGAAEHEAFARLPAVASETTSTLWNKLVHEILPAARLEDLDTFGEHVYQYGILSGHSFASEQGGPFASPAIASVVSALRSMGIRGVGQSSWGPTVFAITESDREAHRVWEELRTIDFGEPLHHQIVAVDNQGAVVIVDGTVVRR